MTGLSEQDVSWLNAANIVLAVACGACVLAVLGGVVWERVARWMLRASLPDCWPPEPSPPPARGRGTAGGIRRPTDVRRQAR